MGLSGSLAARSGPLGSTAAIVRVDVHGSHYHQGPGLGSRQSSENMLVFEAHAVAWVILMWETCAIHWGHGDF